MQKQSVIQRLSANLSMIQFLNIWLSDGCSNEDPISAGIIASSTCIAYIGVKKPPCADIHWTAGATLAYMKRTASKASQACQIMRCPQEKMQRNSIPPLTTKAPAVVVVCVPDGWAAAGALVAALLAALVLALAAALVPPVSGGTPLPG